MADIMLEVLGDLLYTEARDEEGHTLPSPASLRNKILIKGKKLKKSLEEDEGEEDDGEVSDEDEAADINPEHKVICSPLQVF